MSFSLRFAIWYVEFRTWKLNLLWKIIYLITRHAPQNVVGILLWLYSVFGRVNQIHEVALDNGDCDTCRFEIISSDSMDKYSRYQLLRIFDDVDLNNLTPATLYVRFVSPTNFKKVGENIIRLEIFENSYSLFDDFHDLTYTARPFLFGQITIPPELYIKNKYNGQ